MKRFKALTAVAMAATLGMSAAACGKTVDPGRATAETGEITVRIVDKGYSTEWLKRIADAYTEANPGCTVKIITSQDSGAVMSRAQSASNDADIIVSTDSMFGMQLDGYLYDISEVYDSTQEGYDVSLKERMNQSIRRYFETAENKVYQMSWVESYSGYLYNKTVLDEVYGEGNYSLPNTTDELIAMCADLTTRKAGENNIQPIALSQSMSYYDLIKFTWLAQYLGQEKYNNMLRGYYENDAGEYVPCETAEQFKKMISPEGRTATYQALFDLLGNYSHKESDKMNFTDSQNAFLGLGYGTNMDKCAFYLIGDWFLTEMASAIQSSGADIRFMKTIVLSDMAKTLDDSGMSDAELSALIDAIDEGKSHTEAGVSENDYNRVKEARYMTYSAGTYHVLGVPRLRAGGGQYNLAMKFLKYMVTDEAQALYIQAQNGLTMPYGYTLKRAEDDFGLTFNAVAKSIEAAKGDSMVLVTSGGNSLFARSFPLYFGYIEKDIISKVYATPAAAIASVDASYNPASSIALIAK